MSNSETENRGRHYLLVGCIGVLAAVIVSGSYLLYSNVWDETLKILKTPGWYYFLFAFLALCGSYVMIRLIAETKSTGSGTHLVLERYHLSNGEISVRDTVAKTLASIFTLGFGGSAGPEGPSLLIGGGIASAVSRRLNVRVSDLKRVFISGAAAGLAAVFRTPLTGILFALEIPYRNDLDMETFFEACIASIPAYLISIILLGSERIFGPVGGGQIGLNEIFLSLVLGLVCGGYAILFTKAFSAGERFRNMLRKRIRNIGLIVVGTAFLGLTGILSIYSIGVGMNFINAVISGTSFTVALLLMIILLKTFNTIITLNFGGSGGLFFPTIVIGGGIGYLFSSLLDINFKIMFLAVGMAALLSGTHKILLTPTAFVVETLGGAYAIPALLASAVSYVVSGGNSFYPIQPRTRLKAEELALEKFFAKAKASVPEKLTETSAEEFMTKQPVSIHDGSTIKETMEVFEKTRFRVLPVVDDNMTVVGAVTLEDLGNVADKHANELLSQTLMHKPFTVTERANLEEIADMMIKREEDHVFVVDGNGKIVGVISGIDIVRKIMELSSA
jgi:CIC family chloride channel protein